MQIFSLMDTLTQRLLMHPLNISQVRKNFMNLCFILTKKKKILFFPLHNDKNLSVSIEDNTLSGVGSFDR